MKRLAAVVVMIALATFVAAAMALAGETIQGTYAMIATGTCLHSTLGFNGDLTPITGDGSVVWGATTMAQAVWTFNFNGTGTVSYGWNYVLDFPPGSPTFGGPIARQHPYSWNFHYETDDNFIITVYPPSPPNPVGLISWDHKTLTLASANQPQNSAVGPAICNTARVLYRLHD